MKDRGKAVETKANVDMEYYCSSYEIPCSRHPNSSPIGICAYCLKERLVKLVCSDCGEQRLSSCSCSSDISSNRNSCSVEVGSVGRVSFLIENEKNESLHSNKAKDDVVVLRRSSSSCVEIKRGGFWRFGRFFKKNRKLDKDCGNKSVGGFDEKSEIWLADQMGVSRSRSLCSFRGGGGFFGSEDGGEHLMVSGARSSISGFSAARSSSVTNAGMVLDSGRKSGFSEGRRSGFSEAEPRKSGFDGEKKEDVGRKSGFSEGRRSGFSEAEPRKSGFDGEKKDDVMVVSDQKGFSGATKRVFSLKESDFSGMDESRFFDLKLDYSAESKTEDSGIKMGRIADTEYSVFGSMRGSDFVASEGAFGGLIGERIFRHGGSCRLTANDRGIKRGSKSLKGWKWIFRQHSSWGTSRKKDEDFMFKS